MSIEIYKEKYLTEIRKIQDPNLGLLAFKVYSKLPEHFWIKPSSSTGKYHPFDERGIHGLVIHSLRDAKIAKRIGECYPQPIDYDVIQFAALFHDIGKYGFEKNPLPHTDKNHAETGADYIGRIAYMPPNDGHIKIIDSAIHVVRAHMGQWGKTEAESAEASILIMADYVATNLQEVM